MSKPVPMQWLYVLFISWVACHPALVWALDRDLLEERIHQSLATELAKAYPTSTATFGTINLHPAIAGKKCGDFLIENKVKRWTALVSVNVRCLNPQWSFYVRVKADIAVPVAVPTRLIQRGEKLRPELLRIESQSISNLRPHFMTSRDHVTQYFAKLALHPGKPIYSHQISLRNAVEEGAKVMVRALIGAAGVTGYGTALSGGKIGDQISVQNSSSGRIIKAWIWGPGLVGNSPERPSPAVGNIVAGASQ